MKGKKFLQSLKLPKAFLGKLKFLNLEEKRNSYINSTFSFKAWRCSVQEQWNGKYHPWDGINRLQGAHVSKYCTPSANKNKLHVAEENQYNILPTNEF